MFSKAKISLNLKCKQNNKLLVVVILCLKQKKLIELGKQKEQVIYFLNRFNQIKINFKFAFLTKHNWK